MDEDRHDARRFDAILCDIDGCLGPESARPMDTESLARIAAWNRSAIASADRPVLTVCSGRPQPYAEAVCRIVGNCVLPCIAEMGVWMYDPRDNSFEMDPAITPGHRRSVRDAAAWIGRELVPQGVVIQPGKAASISIWHRDTEWLMAQQTRMLEVFGARAWPLRVSRSVAWINCDLAHVSKGTGIDRLARKCGLERDRLVGIGDTMGDMAIRERVGFFACPANADDELKAHADFVSSSTDVAGVLDILSRLLDGVGARSTGEARGKPRTRHARG